MPRYHHHDLANPPAKNLIWGLGFGAWNLGFGIWGLGFGVQCLRFMLQGLPLNYSPADNLPAAEVPHSTGQFSVAAQFNRTFSCWRQAQQDFVLSKKISTRRLSTECQINTTLCSWSHVHQDRTTSAPPNTGVRAAGYSGMNSASVLER